DAGNCPRPHPAWRIPLAGGPHLGDPPRRRRHRLAGRSEGRRDPDPQKRSGCDRSPARCRGGNPAGSARALRPPVRLRLAGVGSPARRVPVYAIVRLDLDVATPDLAIAIKEVVRALPEAEAEVQRLNLLNSG